ncbi:MAG: 50S ribosomal protein L11 methyltransferase [Muribaculum sp.]|nr:50S ribosomal protein L11 methyltransferase [Muribaculaceae bacterium]MCM1081720.1 50S ribosomal protein L11 methyltransferase [Muribaculum sp.]
MNDYTEVRFTATPCNEAITDVLAALLAECDYESFIPDNEGLTAYVKKESYSDESVTSVIESFPIEGVKLSYQATVVEGRDWNAEWEKNYFKPIVIGDRCVIHSTFHTNVPAADYDIVIDPKMAFGTGHHFTTSLMIRRLLELPLEGKSVVDMGTGTGILAILAAMRGATTVNAIEIDEFAQVNAVENVALNDHPEINVILGDAFALDSVPQSDYFLANINRNIILADMQAYIKALKPGGLLIMSGFYKADAIDIVACGNKLGLSYYDHTVDNDWTQLVLRKQLN